MAPKGPRILLLGGTYRALCVLERLLERGERVVAFIGQEGGGERDFCPEILEICDRASVPARSGRKLGEEMVRWLEDRIRPELSIAVGMSTEIPLAIGGNSRLGLLEVIDHFQSKHCPGVVVRQRGQDIITRALPAAEASEDGEAYLELIEATLSALDEYLDRLSAPSLERRTEVSFGPKPLDMAALDRIAAAPDPGPETERLEAELAAYVGAESAVALRDASDAFAALASALEIGEGDEVICPGVVSRAALEGLRRTGARIELVDVEARRLTLDPLAAEEAISERTRALVLCHAFGQPAALDALYALAERRGLEVIEDGASALGARFGESRLGRTPCACSFRVALGPGSHAALLTLPTPLADKVRCTASELRLGNGAAGELRRRLESWEELLSARRETAAHYSSELVRYDAFEVPPTPEGALPAYSQYALRLTRYSRTSADDLHKLLSESGIETRRIGVPIGDRELVRLPQTDRMRVGGLLLPVEQGITSEARERVLDAIFDYAIG
jgi:UDP-2-acetamido-2-deoxy-ribo-hexuluronate aminotransferase